MAVFNNSILTTGGNELIVEAAAGCQIEFTRLVTGSGLYDGAEELASMTSLKEQQQEFRFLRCEKMTERSLLLVSMLSNEGLINGYRMTEIGIYGKLRNSGEEILCTITTANIDKADFWPPFNGISPTRILLRYHVTISPDAVPCVTVVDDVILAEIAGESNRAYAAELALSKQIENKVDKAPGMGLSANDYTTDEKNKLEGIATGAEVNIQPDWNETNRKSSAFIKNKPKSMPASDVYDWAKSPLKPSYDRSEVGLGNVPNVTTNDQVPTFEQAEERDNIKSGEKLSVILGKMMKWFADFSATAFDGIATKWRTARNINGMSVDGSENRANYGICSTASATVAKTVSCVGYGLVTGAEITVRFTVTNTAANPTLNVNSTGAKPIYYRGTAITAGYLAANRTYAFRYNGTQYELVGDIDTNATYNNMSAASASAEGKAGLVPAPSAGKQNAYFRGDGSWVTPTNNLLATEPGTPLDAVMGKELKENLEALNSNLKQTFQAGVDALYNKCKSCGATPGSKTPTAISSAIGTIHTNRYNDGYSAGNAAGYNSGRTQGQNDVKGNPAAYGIATIENSRFIVLASGANANSWSSLDQTFTVTKNGMLTISVFRLYYGAPQVFKNGAGVGAVKSQPGDSNTSKTPQCMDTFAFKVQAGDTIRVYSPTVTTGDNRGAIFIAGVVA